jgi:hypothetical protein
MAMKRIEHEAEKGEFLTLDQVAAFAQDAMRSGAFGHEIVRARVSIGGKLQKLGIEVEPQNDFVPIDE